jgi:hypothetical protein
VFKQSYTPRPTKGACNPRDDTCRSINTCGFALNPDLQRPAVDNAYQLILWLETIAALEGYLEVELAADRYPENVWREPLDNLIRRAIEVATTRVKAKRSPKDELFEMAQEILKGKRELLAPWRNIARPLMLSCDNTQFIPTIAEVIISVSSKCGRGRATGQLS